MSWGGKSRKNCVMIIQQRASQGYARLFLFVQKAAALPLFQPFPCVEDVSSSSGSTFCPCSKSSWSTVTCLDTLIDTFLSETLLKVALVPVETPYLRSCEIPRPIWYCKAQNCQSGNFKNEANIRLRTRTMMRLNVSPYWFE